VEDERPDGPEEALGRRYREVDLSADFPIAAFRHNPWTDPLTRIAALDALEFGICREGRGVFLVEGRLHSYRAGDCAVIRRNDWRGARSDRHDPSTWCFIQLEPRRLVGDPDYRHDLLNGDLLGGVDFPNVIGARSHGMPLELNAAGMRKGRIECSDATTRWRYPWRPFWEIAAEAGCTVIIGSDAHHPDEVAHGEELRAWIDELDLAETTEVPRWSDSTS